MWDGRLRGCEGMRGKRGEVKQEQERVWGMAVLGDVLLLLMAKVHLTPSFQTSQGQTWHYASEYDW